MTRRPAAPEQAKKRPYLTPKLTVHGDLKTLTMAKGGFSNDGTGKPRTKVFGGANA